MSVVVASSRIEDAGVLVCDASVESARLQLDATDR